MRPVVLALAALATLSLAVSDARAAALPVAARLTLQLATIEPIEITGAGMASVNGSGGGGHLSSLTLPANLATTVARVVPVTDPAAAPVQGIQVTLGHAAGTLAEGLAPGGAFGGTLPLVGVAKVCLFTPCAAPAIANLSIPLSVVGVGGSQSVAFLVNVTVTGQPWTTGAASVVGHLPRTGFAHGPASGTSSTAAPSGVVRLVTAVRIDTNIGFVPIPLYATYDLHFVPEPGTLLLLGAGIAGLVAWGRSRPEP